MLVVCWSPKGGVGTSVVAATLALQSAADGAETLLVDLAGDQTDLLGLGGPVVGVGEWLAAGEEVPVDALAALECPVTDRLRLLPRGAAFSEDRLPVLGTVLGRSTRRVVVDAGLGPIPHGFGTGTVSVLVLRACYLALRRVGTVPRTTRVVLIEEPGRALGARDVAAAIGVEPWVCVTADPAVCRTVDAGLLATRRPRSLRPLRLDR